jgi:hypothetical protein
VRQERAQSITLDKGCTVSNRRPRRIQRDREASLQNAPGREGLQPLTTAVNSNSLTTSLPGNRDNQTLTAAE